MAEICVKHCPREVKDKSFLTKGNARDSGDPWIRRRETRRLVSFSSFRSFRSFPSGRIRNRRLRSRKEGVRAMRRSWCRFCIVWELLLLCARNKEIVFTIWDAIWSLTRFRCSERFKKIYSVHLAIVFLNNTSSNEKKCIFRSFFH